MVDILKIELDERRIGEYCEIPDNMLLVFNQEVYRRAAEKESDNLARYGPYYLEIETMADEIIAVFEGKVDANLRVRGILEFNGLLGQSEPHEPTKAGGVKTRRNLKGSCLDN